MKRALALVVGLALYGYMAFGYAHLTQEVLVSNASPTQIPRNTPADGGAQTTGFELYNHGPNNIWCALMNSADAVVGKSRKIAPESTWSADAPSQVAVWCIAETAAQVTGAATVLTESKQ